jgi:RNA polymerase sigma-70 factor (ECF subfamily)
MVYRVARRMSGSHEEADDLSQEAFLRAYRSLPRFRGESMFRTWVVRIVLNLALNRRPRHRSPVPLEQVGPGLASAPEAFEATLRDQVRRAVLTLPPRQRQVLLLKAYEGLKFVEIAEMAGMSVGTAKATFFQAVRGLRGRLGGDRSGPGRGEVAR